MTAKAGHLRNSIARVCLATQFLQLKQFQPPTLKSTLFHFSFPAHSLCWLGRDCVPAEGQIATQNSNFYLTSHTIHKDPSLPRNLFPAVTRARLYHQFSIALLVIWRCHSCPTRREPQPFTLAGDLNPFCCSISINHPLRWRSNWRIHWNNVTSLTPSLQGG